MKFKKEPSEVTYLKTCKMMGWPIGSQTFENTIKKYPEYFPEEAERKRKYDSIPQEVHEAYRKEFSEYHSKLWEGQPKGGGIFSAIEQDETYIKWKEAFDKLYPLEITKEKELKKKYYSKYLD